MVELVRLELILSSLTGLAQFEHFVSGNKIAGGSPRLKNYSVPAD